MNLLLRAAAAAALLLPLAVAPVTAQNYRGAWGIYGGGIWFSDMNDNGGVDIDDEDDFDEEAFLDLTLDPGWIAGTQLEYWFGRGRFGLRANGGYTERSFKVENQTGDFFSGFLLALDDDEDLDFGDVNTWFADGDIMIRILTPRRERMWAPFLSLGAGITHYNPAGSSPPVVIPDANAVFCGDNGDDDDDDFDDDVDDDFDDEGNSCTKFTTPIGIGTDILTGWRLAGLSLGVRLEVADHIAWSSPAEPLFGDDDFDPVHQVRFTAGVHTLFGRLFPEERVAVLPPPAPPPPPAEEMITVCVIDPTAPGGIREVSAIFVPSTGDTLVVVNGNRVPLETAVAEVPVVTEADWYVRGQPLTLTVNGETTEFVTFGGARIIEPEDLALIGTINGMPVYADADEVQDIREELDEMRDADDLEDLLEEREDLREDFEDIEVLYVPVQAVGCVFQPLQRVEEVRKVRG